MKTSSNNLFRWIVLGAAGVSGLVALSGCTVDAYCFSDCGPDAGGVVASSVASSGSGGLQIISGVGGLVIGTTQVSSSSAGGAGCDFNDPHTCGTCDNDCFSLATNWDPQTIHCTPSADPGVTRGTCTGSCSQDYYDLGNTKTGCSYYCVKNASDPDDTSCKGVDDNCNGVKDEGVNVCSDVANCGGCGHNCVVLHGTPVCTNNGTTPCDTSNTQCKISACDCKGPGDCWWDIDNSAATGCEYQCDKTNGGVEICDGLDNDCDGKIDAADDLSGDPSIGASCQGGPLGECAAPAHAGKTACQGGVAVCLGANVLIPNATLETCNGLDDDCDGTPDDNPTDTGGSCGANNIFPCAFGVKQCQAGKLVCVGQVDPAPETCNGIDDDCDGTIDATGGNPPSDAVGPCNVPTAPPPGATSACAAGTKTCVGGTIQCQGFVGPVTPIDKCGVDANCDGVLTNQPDTTGDPQNCGSCGKDCNAQGGHSKWGCTNGGCAFQGCLPGYYDIAGDHKCSYPCTFKQAQEICNNVDDNCDGQIDENVLVPSPTQVCGVTPGATAPECSAGPGGVNVACKSGAWVCTFPANVCNPTCATATELCDTLDNNCNGAINENFPNYNKPCASDDKAPTPGDGACRTTGFFTCNAAGTATQCSAVTAKCSSLAAGCTELCDGIDNDCDGLIDEPFNAKGSNAAYFVQPAVTKIGAAAPFTWIYAYEASRPSSSNIIPGTGNGYVTSAPAGTTLDKTPACSVPGKIPWFNVTPTEVQQTCAAAGGTICSDTSWIQACKTNSATACTWGYGPKGTECTSKLTASKFCNLGPFDFVPDDSTKPATMGDQDGLLPGGSASLMNCFADWAGVNGNAAGIFDMTGNLHEITQSATTSTAFPLMGGAYNTQNENGAACTFEFYTVNSTFALYDTGFRCCFSSDPTQ